MATRDLVARLAPNLAKAAPIGGLRPGIRLEVPRNLLPTFKLLERHGHLLRGRHGPELKRHIKFDDAEQGLVMDVKLPGEDEWVRMTPAFVSSLKKENINRQLERNRTRLSASEEGGEKEKNSGQSQRSRENAGWNGLRPRNTNGFTLANRNIQIPTSDTLSRGGNGRRGWGSQNQ